VETTAARLSQSGIAYVVPSVASTLRRALAAAGLPETDRLLHIPNVAQSRYLAPIASMAERYALSGQLPMTAVKRLAARALGVQGRRRLGPTGALHRRQPATLARWLFDFDNTAPGSALVTARQPGAGGAIVHRFSDAPAPNAVAKVSPRANDELHGLQAVAPSAASAIVRVPRVLYAGTLGSVPLVVQSAVEGRNAALLIEQKRLAARRLQADLAAWLECWGRSEARVRQVTDRDVQRFVLSPAAELVEAGAVHASYLDYLRALCAGVVGSSCTFVPNHGDLTAANIFIARGGELGVVDWEEAQEDSLPLCDFLYAAADAASARESYADRPAAFAACFSRGGESAYVESLRQRLAEASGVGSELEEICFHACWLNHARNETARSRDGRQGPFVKIVQAVASDPALARRGIREPRRR